MNIPVFTTHILANGLRIAHLSTDSPVAYCGFAVNAGSRDELKGEEGLAHFVEHTLFKGTLKRKASHILNRMENVGGELNAYTTKESTFLYSIFMEKDLERAIELTSDLIVNSQFPEHELAKEREVVFDEIRSYKDMPSDLIFDDFENMIFTSHPLGHHILGDKRSIKSFDSAACKSFLQRFYSAGNMAFFCQAKTDFKRIVRLAEKYMEAIPSHQSTVARTLPKSCPPCYKHEKKKTHLSHVITGGRSYDMFDERRFPFFLLNNLLGGPGMNSRLNVSLREKHGYTYTVESNVSSLTDTGVFSVYFGTDAKNREKAAELVSKELKTLRECKLTPTQLAAAKKQAIGQLCVASDNMESRFLGLGKSILYHGRYETLPETLEKIERITASQILEAANEIMSRDRLSSIVYE